jgi:predicted nucleotidyltransferase
VPAITTPLTPTPYPDANALLEYALTHLRALLGDQFVGMYLFGSLALNAFTDGSDVDYVVVTESALPDTTIAQLAALHERIAALPMRYATEIEAAYIPRAAFRRYDYGDRHHPHIDRGVGERLTVRQFDEDWIVQRYVLYQHGITVAGPDVRTLLDPVTADALNSAVRIILDSWWCPMLDDPIKLLHLGYQAYAVLSMCRMAYTLEHGAVLSKPAAAQWMIGRLPEYADVIRRALDWQIKTDDLVQTQAMIRLVCAQSQIIRSNHESRL